MIRVYVAGPYSSNPERCTSKAINAGEELRRSGIAPFVPHLFHHWHPPLAYEDAMAIDLAFLEVCDALVRLAGESPGADREVDRAHELGIRVFDDIAECVKWARGVEAVRRDRASALALAEERARLARQALRLREEGFVAALISQNPDRVQAAIAECSDARVEQRLAEREVAVIRERFARSAA